MNTKQPLSDFKKIHLQITNKCNFKCRHCYIGNAGKDVMSCSFIEDIFKNFKNKNLNLVSFSGGEPLLAIEIIHCILDVINKFNINVKMFSFPTNGTYLLDNVDLIELLFNNSSGKVGISVSYTSFHRENKEIDIKKIISQLPKDKVVYEIIDDDYVDIINIGRAKDLTKNSFDYTRIEKDTLFIGVDGYVYDDAFFFGDKTKRKFNLKKK